MTNLSDKYKNSLNIFVTDADLDSRIIISSASPTSGNIDGRIWVDISTASAPVIQNYGNNSFRIPKLSKNKALGGTITTSGPYTIHTFTSLENFVVYDSSLTVDYLVVAGGGAGGDGRGGGGGGGGYKTSTNLSALHQIKTLLSLFFRYGTIVWSMM